MTNIVNTGNASVDALAEMSISGNVTPVKWQAIPSRYLCVVGNRVLVSSCGSTGRA